MTENKTNSRIWSKIKLRHLTVALFFILITFIIFFKYSLKSQFQDKIDKLSTAGFPVTFEELDKYYKIPESTQNAADTMIQAFPHLRTWDPNKIKPLPRLGEARWPPRTEPLDEKTKALVAEFIADNAKALKLIHQTSKIEHCRYPLDFGRGYVYNEHLNNLKKCAQRLDLEAILHAEDSQPELALRSVKSLLALGQSLNDEPLMISQLVRIALQAIAVSSLEQVVNRVELTDEQLTLLTEELTAAQDLSGLYHGYIGERCIGIYALKYRLNFDIGRSYAITPKSLVTKRRFHLLWEIPLLALYHGSGLSDIDSLFYLDSMEGYIKAVQLSPFDCLNASKALEDKRESKWPIHYNLYWLLGSEYKVTEINIRLISHLRAAQVGLAVQRYRLATGKPPENVSELIPTYLETIPKDPFDDKLIRYKKLKTGFVAYSIGEDRTDDGGKERSQEVSRSVPHDLTFIIER